MSTATLNQAKRRTAWVSVGLAFAMISLAYASVPLYRLFCQVTGYAGTTGRAEAAALPSAKTLQALGGRSIKIRFDGNVSPGMPWQFGPDAPEVKIKIGARSMAFYHATNMSAAPSTGRALFNVSPDTAGKYFKKIACFCFNEQTLRAGENASMPVTYFVDPAILDDPDAKKIDEITLSYTFFPVDVKAEAAVNTAATRKE